MKLKMWCGKHSHNICLPCFAQKELLHVKTNQTIIDLFLFLFLNIFFCFRYPNVHDPEDNILALKKRAALQFNIEDISDYVLMLDGDEVDSDV